MRSLFNISRMSFRGALSQTGVAAQVIRGEKLANIQSNTQIPQSDNLKKLKQFMEYHKFSKAIKVTQYKMQSPLPSLNNSLSRGNHRIQKLYITIDVLMPMFLSKYNKKEIDRLASEKVDMPIQNILEQLVKNEEFELTNKLYDILQKQEIKLSDISYNYLIDANLKFKNTLNALNIAIHAYLSGVVLDIEAYRGLFSAIPPEMDNSFRQVLYKMYKQDFNLSTKILYDLVILTNATKDFELLNELEEDTVKQGLKMPENLNKLINRDAAKKKQKNQETDQIDIKEQQETKKQEEPQETQVSGAERSYGYQPVFNYDDIIPDQNNMKNGFNSNSIFNYQNMDMAGNDILRFLKKGQQKGVFSSKQAPMIFIIKQQGLSEFDDMEQGSDEEYSGDIGYEGEGLNSYSDEESD